MSSLQCLPSAENVLVKILALPVALHCIMRRVGNLLSRMRR
jgi:hypothetical protein